MECRGGDSCLPEYSSLSLRRVPGGFEGNLLADNPVFSFSAVPSLGSRKVCRVPLGSPGAQWPEFKPARSLCLSAPSCRRRNWGMRPGVEASWSALANSRPILQRVGLHHTRFTADELEGRGAEEWLVPGLLAQA